MQEQKDPSFVFKTKEGMTVILIPKPGYHQFLAALTTHYGSLTTKVSLADQSNLTIPAGSAHFLEHKMFDKADGDVLLQFAGQGADANAFTGPNQTTYYFTATSQKFDNLALLLSFVQEPYFTEAKVERERGIITEEIKLYQDDPNAQLYQNLLTLLYPEAPISQDIAGTPTSLKAISADLLYHLHDLFYQPSNLTLTVVGDFNPQQLADFIQLCQEKIGDRKQKFIPITETLPKQRQRYLREKYGLSLEKGAYGLRLPSQPVDLSGYDRVKAILLGEICLELIFGDQTKWFQEAYAQGIFGDEFDYEYTSVGPYQYLTLFADGANQEKVADSLQNRLNLAVDVLNQSQNEFSRLKKALAGDLVTRQNRPDGLGLDEDLVLYGVSLFDKMKLIMGFSIDDVVQFGQQIFPAEQLTSVVLEK